MEYLSGPLESTGNSWKAECRGFQSQLMNPRILEGCWAVCKHGNQGPLQKQPPFPEEQRLCLGVQGSALLSGPCSAAKQERESEPEQNLPADGPT